MSGNVSTLEQECAEQGLDYEEVLDQRALEKQMMEARGLTQGEVGASSSTAQPSAPNDEDEDLDEPSGESRGRTSQTQTADA
jgi:capsid protein